MRKVIVLLVSVLVIVACCIPAFAAGNGEGMRIFTAMPLIIYSRKIPMVRMVLSNGLCVIAKSDLLCKEVSIYGKIKETPWYHAIPLTINRNVLRVHILVTFPCLGSQIQVQRKDLHCRCLTNSSNRWNLQIINCRWARMK